MRERSGPPTSPGAAHPRQAAPRSAADIPAGWDSSGSALPDRLLAVRAAEGDDDAFAALVRRHSGRLTALAYRLLGNRADAEDAVQDAFLSAWRQLPEFRHGATFGTWMYRIVTNRCLNTLRRRPPALPLDTIPEPVAADAGSAPPRVAETDATTAALTQALRELSPELRACWILRELHGLHYDEIAHVTASSEQTVRGRLFRARRALTEAMRPWR
ncbi:MULTISPECIES: RNA polymerase sigma factor [unclassified Streptomyces]|uniref:RNA polymerase sigma factor n=1 Tax=unclassified Streptomyces TaxID=2593676 RepID=UPI001BEA1791|nr:MULTISPECIES: sigma-70 family RNA polymerase sigma factor [unclassified Streptomyces]MBT2404924.1 sigma-70 family RNA polymerase sigma factor [Streptomyces sp. ISL-21]MBT2455958.1 sigma-70 family RNA polymerase sigma factor [Streptomyces sp. ISL-86]MBT2611347.1 sigma-70 family RNA polymerase sigma factor [Streptomyces sp. ISL-87]